MKNGFPSFNKRGTILLDNGRKSQDLSYKKKRTLSLIGNKLKGSIDSFKASGSKKKEKEPPSEDIAKVVHEEIPLIPDKINDDTPEIRRLRMLKESEWRAKSRHKAEIA